VTPLLRPYQASGVSALRAHILAGRKRVIACLSTGGGKTVVAAHIIHSARTNFNARVLFVAHRKELIDQAVRQLAKWGVIEVGVIMAEDARTNTLLPVQVASIQSLARRSAPPADIVFVDECHRSAANSYRKLLALYPDAVIIGLTATPCRGDGKPLKDVFDEIAVLATYSDLIRDKFILEPRCFSTERGPDLSKVRTLAGDFVLDELEDAMLAPQVLGDTLAEYQARAEGRKCVIFAVSVAHSRAIEKQFLEAGIRIAHVDAETPKEERDDISRKLDAGELDVVTNVGVYTEGWDQPCVKLLMIARPTKSLVLFLQMVGRGLRPWSPNTPVGRSWQESDGPSVIPVVVDCGENIERHGWPTEDRTWSLDGKAKRQSEKRPAKCIKCRCYIQAYPCPACGFAPEVSPCEVRIDASAKLVERERIFVDPRRTFFDESLRKARSSGYKPGFAGAKYREKYDEWPPWSWSQFAKDEFARDAQWRRRNEQHERFRKQWNEGTSDEPVQYETDEDIAEWAKGYR